MRLGGTVISPDKASWEQHLVASRFRAIPAPFNCDSPRDEIERYCDIARRHDVAIAEVGVWLTPSTRKTAKPIWTTPSASWRLRTRCISPAA